MPRSARAVAQDLAAQLADAAGLDRKPETLQNVAYRVDSQINFYGVAFEKAIKWARKQGYSYEQDGDWGIMMLEAALAGELQAGVDYDVEEVNDTF